MIEVFIVAIAYVYSVVGAGVGLMGMAREKWPVYNEGTNTINGDKTVPFILLCGPLFWIIVLLIWIFKRIWKIIE